MFYALKIAKAGFYSGNPQEVMNAPVNMVIAILHFELFENALQKEYSDMMEAEES